MKPLIYFISLLFVLALNDVQAQNAIVKPNTAYVELLGSGGLYSLNYERFLIKNSKQAYGIRVGGSYWNTQTPYINVIGELVGLVGAGNHHADFAIGLTGGSAPNHDVADYQHQNHLYAVPRIGYRYQKPAGGTMIRFGLTPFIALTTGTPKRASSYPLYIGLAIGQSF